MEKKKILIDCDPGIDDALALMLACASPELDILGITIVSGNIHALQCARNAYHILEVMGRTDIPIYLGETGPLKRDLVLAEETHGADGLGGIHYTTPDTVPFKDGGVAFLAETLKKEAGVTLIAIGPLTNVAKLITDYPDVLGAITELILMGGAFKSHGNCSPVAEFNFWADPDAAAITLNQLGQPITMVGLDVTREVVLTPNYIELLRQLHTPLADKIVAITRFYTDFHWEQERTLGCVINDPLAIAYCLDPTLCQGQDYYVDVITEGKAIGMSMVDVGDILKKEPNCHVLTTVKSRDFMILFLLRLFPEHEKDILAVVQNPKYSYE